MILSGHYILLWAAYCPETRQLPLAIHLSFDIIYLISSDHAPIEYNKPSHPIEENNNSPKSNRKLEILRLLR